MKFTRATLLHHLEHIMCGGQIEQAVFTGAFGTQALTPDQHLLVLAPPLPKGKTVLKESVGVADLELFVKVLNALSGEGNEALTVNIKHEDHRLILDEEHRGLLRLMTARPKTIATFVAADTVTKVKAKLPKNPGKGIPLTKPLVEGVCKTFGILKVAEVELFVGPDGGRFQVGGEHSHMASFSAPELVASREYSLRFGSHLIDVLGVVSNYNEAVLHLGPPGGFAVIHDGPYEYLISSRVKSADEE